LAIDIKARTVNAYIFKRLLFLGFTWLWMLRLIVVWENVLDEPKSHRYNPCAASNPHSLQASLHALSPMYFHHLLSHRYACEQFCEASASQSQNARHLRGYLY